MSDKKVLKATRETPSLRLLSLPLLAGILSMVNAAGFLFMSVGARLVDFIVLSSIFSTVSWLYGWVTPALFRYSSNQISNIRSLQILIALAGCLIILSTRRFDMALCFITLIFLEIWLFPQSILLLDSNTSLYFKNEIFRGVMNFLLLVAVVVCFGGSPILFVLGLPANYLMSAGFLWVVGRYSPPSLRFTIEKLNVVLFDALRSSRPFWMLLGARAIEVGSLSMFGYFNAMAWVLSFKLGMALTGLIASAVRSFSIPVLVALFSFMYAGVFLAIRATNQVDFLRARLPDSLEVISIAHALAVFPLLICTLIWTAAGLRSVDRQ